jgi:hypothetical protein
VAYLSLARCTERYWLVEQLEGNYRAQPSWTINLHQKKKLVQWSSAPDGVEKLIKTTPFVEALRKVFHSLAT